MKKKPLVQCITNNVTMNDCANVLLAAEASPTMAHHVMEVAEIQSGCDALVCNLGATDDYEAMLIAAKTAGEKGHPIIIDPVGVGGSSFRRNFFKQLCQQGKVTVVRGNYSEILALASDTATVTGVDGAIPELERRAHFGDTEDLMTRVEQAVRSLAARLKCVVVASGETDLISDGEKFEKITAGDPFMSRITGCGCMSTALMGAFVVSITDPFEAAVACCRRIGKCGEEAAALTRKADGGTMTFRMYFIDTISKRTVL